MLIVVSHAMNCLYMLVMFSATHCNSMNSPIYDSYLMTSIGHKMSYQKKNKIATEAQSVPSPLYMHIVYVFDTMGHMTTMVAYQPCQLIFTYKIRLR